MSYLIPKLIPGLATSPSPQQTMRDLGTKEELLHGDFMKRMEKAFSSTFSKGESRQVREAAEIGATGAEEKREAFRCCIKELVTRLSERPGGGMYAHISVEKLAYDTLNQYMRKSLDLESGLAKLDDLAQDEKDAIDYLRRQQEESPEKYKDSLKHLSTQTQSEGLVEVVDLLVSSATQDHALSMMHTAAEGQLEKIEKKTS